MSGHSFFKRSKTYYLHEGKVKTGKPKYHFSMKKEGKLVKKIPDGYEIYEHPTNAQVFLRKKQPRVITDTERRLIDKYLKKIKTSRRCIFDVKLIGYNLIISNPKAVLKPL